MKTANWSHDPKVLLERTDGLGGSVASRQILQGWRTEDPELLTLRDPSGHTIAHLQARKGWTTEDTKILSLRNSVGDTVADTIVRCGELKGITANVLKRSVRVCALCGVFDHEVLTQPIEILTKLTLLIKSAGEKQVGWETTEPCLLELTNACGYTVAEIQRG